MLVSLMKESEKVLHFSGDDFDFNILIGKIKDGFYLTNSNSFSSYLDISNFESATINNNKINKLKTIWDNTEAFWELLNKNDCEYYSNNECKCDFCTLGTHGVSDNMEQVIARYENYLNRSKNYWVVTGSYVYKEDQPDHDGWRWEKWGSYIGDKKPTSDYLYDELEIDEVMLYDLHMLDIEFSLS